MDDIPEITAMRGYASFGVVIFHLFVIAGLVIPTLYSSIVLSWDSGVDFFFVLSGFLLTAPFIARAGRQNLRNYYLKRIFRTIPVYYLSVVVVGSVFLVFYHTVTVRQIIANLYFVQSFFPSTFNSVNGVNWTLIIEEIFYATLPAFALFFLWGRWKVALPVFLAISIAYRCTVVHEYGSSGDLPFYLWQYPSYVGHYALGATLANFYVNGKARAASRYKSSIPMLACIALVVATQFWIGAAYSDSNERMALPGMLFAFEYTALIYSAITSPVGSLARKIFINRMASSLGKVSYSLYAWHLPVEIILFGLGLPFVEWGVLSVATALGVAIASYYFVERPFLRLRARVLSRKAVEPQETPAWVPNPTPIAPRPIRALEGSFSRRGRCILPLRRRSIGGSPPHSGLVRPQDT